MITKDIPQDNRPYKEQIESQFKEAMRCLKMIRPEDFDDKLQYYIGLNLALLELKRIALDEPTLYAY